ncbi:hypothetical protein BDZ91DRAFT_802155 [Kalaharituber pfeilii]|nr:hypothetical protein BDZ91DRAFT_802155 [Kalaharituber pfeilii]
MTVPYIGRKATITKTKQRQRNERTNDEATGDDTTDDERTDNERTDDVAESRKSPLTSIFGTDFVIPRPFSANYNP